MKFLSLSYVRSAGYDDPHLWLDRIKPYGIVLEALARRHSVFSIEQIDYQGEHNKNGVEYHFIREKNKWFPSAIHKLVKKIDPEVVIVHGLNHPLQIIQLRRTLGRNAKLLIQSHAEKIPSGWRTWVQKIADRNVDGYLFTSIAMADQWLRRHLIADKRKIQEVMAGASTFEPADKLLSGKMTGVKGEPNFLFVGRIDENKDPYTLIKAFSIFVRSNPSASLYCIFSNEDQRKQLEDLVREYKSENSIHLIGRINHIDMQSWFSSADFIVSTSHAEAFGMAVSEGMSCGCFPIVTSIPSFKKLTAEGRCGLLFEAGNVDQLINILREACTLNLQIERLKVIKHYETYLSADAIAEQIQSAALSIPKSSITASADSSAVYSKTRL